MNNIFNVNKYSYNRRIDNWIFSKFRNIPKKVIYTMIRKGKIKVNSNKIKCNYKLKINDIIFLNNIFYNKKKEENNTHKYFFSNKFFENILYEDKYILIINKPYGLYSQGGNNIKYNVISSIKNIYNNNYKLLHRLDKNTSGILMISKNDTIVKNINEQFKKKTIEKKYYALVNGFWKKKNNYINLPLLKVLNKDKKYISVVSKNGKKSLTIFKIKKYLKNNMTLITAIPVTGRMHQIRSHCKFLKNSIVLDKLYGDNITNKKIYKLGLKRMFLHSYSIIFFHPIYNKYIKVISNMDNELLNFIDKN